MTTIYVPEMTVFDNYEIRENFQIVAREIHPENAVQIQIIKGELCFGYISHHVAVIHHRADGGVDELKFVVVKDCGENRKGAFAALRAEFQKLIRENPKQYLFSENFSPGKMGI